MNCRRLTVLVALALLGCGEFTSRVDGEVVDETGGELRAEGAVVLLAPGAVDAAIVLRIALVEPDALPEFAQRVTRPLRIEPTDLILAQPSEITLDYSGEDAAAENLTIVRIDRNNATLTALDGLRLDPGTQTLSAELTQLGEFALLAECTADADCAMDEICEAGGCVDMPVLEEICGDGIDDDQDGRVDEGCEPDPEEICGDGLDNDRDGMIDEDCGTACGADNDCAPGQRCVDGLCQ